MARASRPHAPSLLAPTPTPPPLPRPQDDSLKQQEDGQGFTPLATAAEVGNEEIARLLLDKGVDVDQLGSPVKRSITALMVACAHKQASAGGRACGAGGGCEGGGEGIMWV